MKKVLLSFCVLATAGAFAQTHEKGQIQFNVDYELQVGSSLNLEVDGDDVNTDDFTVTVAGPRLDAQYGVSDNFGIGLLVRMATSKTEIDGLDGESEASHFDIGLSPRYYLLNTDDMNVFAKASVGLTTQNPKEEDGQEDLDNVSGLFWGVGGGLNYMFSDMFGANVQVAYGSRNYSEDVEFGTETIETKSMITGIDIGVGVTIVL